MAKFNGRYFYKIDVMAVMSENGYSFMISTANELPDENDALNIAFGLNCFENDQDVNYALVDDLVSERVIKQFIECGCCYQE